MVHSPMGWPPLKMLGNSHGDSPDNAQACCTSASAWRRLDADSSRSLTTSKLAGPTPAPALRPKPASWVQCAAARHSRVMSSMGQRSAASASMASPAWASSASRDTPCRCAAASTVFTQPIDTVACKIKFNGP